MGGEPSPDNVEVALRTKAAEKRSQTNDVPIYDPKLLVELDLYIRMYALYMFILHTYNIHIYIGFLFCGH